MADHRIPATTVRRVWQDRRLTTAQASAAVGLARSNLWRRAKAMGLEPRPKGNRPVITDEALFARMWRAGVTAAEIARHFHCHHLTPSQTARRLGLPRRKAGGRQAGLSLDDFLAVLLAEALQQAAAAEERALDEARMRDHHVHRLGRRKDTGRVE